MVTIKAYTDIEQSSKLAEILQLESADMYWWFTSLRSYIEAMDDGDFNEDEGHIRAWSLAALLEQLPSVIKGHNLTICKDYWQIEKTFAYELSYEEDFEDYPPSILISTSSIELIDATYDMIIHLHELNLL